MSWLRCSMIRIVGLIVGVFLIVGGIAAWLLLHTISGIDTGSVAILVARGEIGPEQLSKLRFGPWREPRPEIQPFPSRPEAFERGKIIRYRQGSRKVKLLVQTYYEAEYLMPDGRTIVGPALGPMAYTTPNSQVLLSAIVSGAIMLIVSFALWRRSCSCVGTTSTGRLHRMADRREIDA